MGVRDVPFWGRVAAEVANLGLDSLGAKRCAANGHKWRAVEVVIRREDGGEDHLPKGSGRRCARCGATQQGPLR